MTAVMETDDSLVANEIIQEAFEQCGISAEGEPLTAEMYARGLRALNLIMNTWTAAEHLWTMTETTLTPIATMPGYAMPPGAKRVISVRRKMILGGYETPMTALSRQEYYDQPNKTGSPSTPVNYFFDPQVSAGTLYVWPVPSLAVFPTILFEVTYLRSLATITSSGAIPDVPAEWQQALVYALAAQLALKYGVAPDIRGEIQGRAAALYADLKAFDNETTSLFLQPDDRWQGGGFYR